MVKPTCSGDSKGGPERAMAPQIFAWPPAWPPFPVLTSSCSLSQGMKMYSAHRSPSPSRGPTDKSVCAQKNTFHLHAEFKTKKRVLGNKSEPPSNGVGPQKRVPPSRSEGRGAGCAGIGFNTAVSRVGFKLFTETHIFTGYPTKPIYFISVIIDWLA